MKSKRITLFWTVATVALLVLLGWLFEYPGWPLHSGGKSNVKASSAEALLLFDENPAGFAGPWEFSLRKGGEMGFPRRFPSTNVVVDRIERKATVSIAYLKWRLRSFPGKKQYTITTTNASLRQLASAFAFYSTCQTVIVIGDPEEMYTPLFGKFDSERFRTKWGTAGAIVKLLDAAGWRLAELVDSKAVFLSQNDYDLLLATKSPGLQESLLRKFDEAKGPEKPGPAQKLSRLWHAGFLSDRIKEELTERHYRLRMRQHTDVAGPSWDVRCEQTFLFPDVMTDFTPTLYLNDQVKWSPGRSQRSCAMNEANGIDRITSMSGGEFKNGEVLQCKIELAQKINGRSWRMTLWSNKIVLQGLKN